MSLWANVTERASSWSTWLGLSQAESQTQEDMSEQSSQQATSANCVNSDDEVDWEQKIRESEEFKQDPTKCLLGLGLIRK